MLRITGLHCEYAVNPIGLDTLQPRFGWILQSDRRCTLQSTYRVLVASSPQNLTIAKADLWDSGETSCPQSAQIEYQGRPLVSGERCYWTVHVRDNHDRSAQASEPAWFEMGLLHDTDWKACWIGLPAAWSGRGLLMRNLFELDKPVQRARAYICGLGYYELRLNGQKVGDEVLEPACTVYTKRVLYAVHDVTERVHIGKNVIGAMVGNGWYGVPMLILQLNITFTDGSTACFATGERGAFHGSITPGPVLSNGIYDGEVYDARLDRAGWDTPEGELDPPADRRLGWCTATLVDGPGGRLAARNCESMRVVETLRPRDLKQPVAGVWVFDLGQNIAGWARLRVSGPRGTRISLRFAELLYPDGTINQENLRTARAEDVYILKGGGLEEWEPRFTYHGFRYIQMEGFPGEPNPDNLDGRVVRSDVARRGAFTCNHALINRIQSNILWTEASNLHGIPTDCPQRDERMGWLNDMSARSEEALYNFDLPRFFTKWLADIADTQDPLTGAITDTAPYRFGNRPADPVSVAYLLIPWLLYQHYGDTHILREHFAGMKKWVDYLASRSKDYILNYSYWGDWAPPLRQIKQGNTGGSGVNASAPGALVSTAFFYYHAKLLSDIAKVLGKTQDQQVYAALADGITRAFQREFWNDTLGGYGTGSQSCNALAKYLGLVPPNRAPTVAAALAREIEKEGGHLTTGNIGTKYLLETLTNSDLTEIAFVIAVQETYPSWGYMIANGATTVWERWEYATGKAMNSHNHPMLCSISSWFYRALAGIRVDESGAGFARFSIRPRIVGNLHHATAELNTMRGPVRVEWQLAQANLTMKVNIPANSEGQISLPKRSGTNHPRICVDGQVLWQNDTLIGTVDGIHDATNEERFVTFVAGSGSYVFTVENE